MGKVLLTKKLGEKSRALLESIPGLELVTVPDARQALFDEHIKDARALLLSTAYEMPRDVIEKAEKLEVISRTGAGVDNVDVTAATQRKILVLNTPLSNSLSVAEHAVAMILALSKQLLSYDRELRKGNFKIRRSGECSDLFGKTLGLVGCGNIGRLTARKCKAAFDMRVIGYDPYVKELDGVTLYEDVEEIFKRADYISLHLPLTPGTKNLIGAKLLSLMKPTAYIINTSRGGIIHEGELAEALEKKVISGAGLDVFESEPPPGDHPLLGLPNVLLTPHSAALSKECSARVEYDAVEGICDYLKGNTPKFVYNKELPV